MNRSIKILVFLIITSCCLMSVNAQTKFNYKPPDGYVPNKEVAVRVAEVIWLPVYGTKIYESKPFLAELSKDGKVWIVRGTLKTQKGGVPYIEIQKDDCKILRMYHSK